ncbi:MAG: Mur ligase family protein [Bacillota bacterium]
MTLFRFYVAIWLGKLLVLASRLTRRGGSTFPGRVARRICPDILTRLSGQARWGNIVVSGTNGKTTTSLLLANILSASGMKLVHNRTGANLVYGVTATFIQASSWMGRLDADVAVLECDEAALAGVARAVEPRAGVVTNFFRDQLDRYGELEYTVTVVCRGLEAVSRDGFVVLNADDPAVAGLASRLPTRPVFYGLDDPSCAGTGEGAVADARRCRACGGDFSYEVFYFAHLGLYFCPQCGERRPRPDIRVTRRDGLGPVGSYLEFDTPGGAFAARLPIPGLYNAYNALAAVACALTMGIPAHTVAHALESSVSSFGRMEQLAIGDRTVFLALIKNPAGCNEVLRTIMEGAGERHLLIAINDNTADGTDVSWLWDAGFELLAGAAHRLPLVLTAGIRAEDMAVRLKYAGLPSGSILVENDLKAAVRLGLERIPAGGILYVLPTYTAMLDLRRVLNDMGYGRRFWEV